MKHTEHPVKGLRSTRQANSPEPDLTSDISSSMRRANRSQYGRMQEVIAALSVCVCVLCVCDRLASVSRFEPRLKFPWEHVRPSSKRTKEGDSHHPTTS